MSTIVKHSKCGRSWRQRGNRTGHCSACHESFEGVALFDVHQRVAADGSVTCRAPASIEHPKGWLLKQDDLGTWSTTKPSPFAKVAQPEEES